MADIIHVDFKDKRKEYTWMDPNQLPQIIHLDECIKNTIKALLRCTNDKQWLQAQLIMFEDMLDKAKRDVPK